jgi:hypothetical protein
LAGRTPWALLEREGGEVGEEMSDALLGRAKKELAVERRASTAE